MNSVLSPWLTHRHSGVLAHLSSLPSDVGIGNLGAQSRRFVDFLKEAGFTYWQMCPVGPTGFGDSPYQSFSTYAGNPYFIDLEELLSAGLLKREEIDTLAFLSKERVDYGGLYENFWNLLERAHQRFEMQRPQLSNTLSQESFLSNESEWINDYTNFMALKRRFNRVSWIEWPFQFRSSPSNVEERFTNEDRLEKSRHLFYQYVFAIQWNRLKTRANESGIELIGDLPIYVALDSADAWANRSAFRIDELGGMESVAGVPPDYFSATGQLWGNPLYDWDSQSQNGFQWWIQRIKHSQRRFDAIRFDHFRAIHDYWAVPSDAPNASHGHWESGPGIDFFKHIERNIENPKIIAEDLGYINQGVYDLREQSGLPGMKVIQFGYDHDDNNVNLPHFYKPNHVVYTGTHDNDTTQGWLDSLQGESKQRVFDYFRLGSEASARDMIVSAFASVANLAIVPLQDLLNLPSSCRMNTPGVPSGNWQWRLTDAQFDRLERRELPELKTLHQRFNRINDRKQRNFSAPPLKALDTPDEIEVAAIRSASR